MHKHRLSLLLKNNNKNVNYFCATNNKIMCLPHCCPIFYYIVVINNKYMVLKNLLSMNSFFIAREKI